MKKESIIKYCFWVVVSILIYQIALSTISILLSNQITQVKVYTNRSAKGGIKLSSFDRKEIKSDIVLNSKFHDSTDNFYGYTLPNEYKNDRITLGFNNNKERTAKVFEIHLISNYLDFKIKTKKFSEYLQETSPCTVKDGKYVFLKNEGNRIVLDFVPFSKIVREEIRYKPLGLLLIVLSVFLVFLLEHFNVFSKIFNSKKKASSLAVNVAFIAILFSPMLIWFMHWDIMKTSENRKLNAISDFRSYFDVMFPHKSSLVYSNQFINEKLFLGPHNIKNVAVGKDEYLYKYVEGSDVSSYFLRRKHLSESKLKEIEERIVDHDAYCKDKGIEYLRVYYPAKYNIYPENLPYALRSAIKDTISRKEQMLTRLSTKGIDIISFEKMFEAHKYKTLYRKMDTHWNNLGGFFSSQHVMQKLYEKTNLEYYAPTNLEDYILLYEEVVLGDIIAKMANYPYDISDMSPILFPNFPYEYNVDTNDKRLPYNSTTITNSKSKSDKTLVIFSDSFVISQRKYYAMNFRTVYHLRDQAFNKELIELLKPDVIIEGYSEISNQNLKL